VARGYVPDRGDIVWIEFDPQAGHEQAGKRPALAVSKKSYNERAGLALFCPVTNQTKGYPFEIPLGPESKVTGVVLADQLKSMDFRARRAKLAGKATHEVVADLRMKLHALID